MGLIKQRLAGVRSRGGLKYAKAQAGRRGAGVFPSKRAFANEEERADPPCTTASCGVGAITTQRLLWGNKIGVPHHIMAAGGGDEVLASLSKVSCEWVPPPGRSSCG